MDKSTERQYEEYARNVPMTTPEREKELSELITGATGDTRDQAILELVNGNMRLVLDLTSKYRNMPDYPDTLFDGNLGLIKAADSFDIKKGRFTTWATPKIRTEIRNGMYQRSSSLSSLRSAAEILAKAEKLGRTADATVTRLAMMEFIPLYDNAGKPLEVCDHNQVEVSELVHQRDLFSLVVKAAKELNLTEEDLLLVSESNDAASKGAAVASMGKTKGVTNATVRMMRAKLVWLIRKKILGYVGKDEYLLLSAIGLPKKNWR